jgi:hypothetical protein
MSLGAADAKSTQAGTVFNTITAEGGSSAITKVHGPGVAVARLDTGDYKLTWDESPGVFRGATVSLSANDPTALAGHTVVNGEFESDLTMLVNVTNASDAAHDLAADEYFTLRAEFSTTDVDGA